MLHPDALGDRSAQAPAFQGAFCAAEQVGHFLFGDFVDVTGVSGFHGMVSTPPVAAGWWSGGCSSRFGVADANTKGLAPLIQFGVTHEALAVMRHEFGVAGGDG